MKTLRSRTSGHRRRSGMMTATMPTERERRVGLGKPLQIESEVGRHARPGEEFRHVAVARRERRTVKMRVDDPDRNGPGQQGRRECDQLAERPPPDLAMAHRHDVVQRQHPGERSQVGTNEDRERRQQPAPVADLIVVPRSRQNAQVHAVATGTSDITDVDMNSTSRTGRHEHRGHQPGRLGPETPADAGRWRGRGDRPTAEPPRTWPSCPPTSFARASSRGSPGE